MEQLIYRSKGLSHYKVLRPLIKYIANHKGFIAGGVFKDIFNGDEVKDLDILFHNKEDFEEANQYYKTLVEIDSTRWRHVYTTDNSIGYKDLEEGIVIDLIRVIYSENSGGGVFDVLDKFDFTVTKAVLYKNYKNDYEKESEESDMFGDVTESGTGLSIPKQDEDTTFTYTFGYHVDYFEHLSTRTLEYSEDEIFNIDGNPISMMNRVIRYVAKGYLPSFELKRTLVEHISGLDRDTLFNHINVAEEHEDSDEDYDDLENIDEVFGRDV